MSKEEYTAYWKCRVCGAKSLEDAKVCRQCGADLLLHADLVSSEPTPPPPPPEPPIDWEEEESETKSKKKDKDRDKKEKVKKEKVKREKRPAKEKKGIKGWLLGLAAVLAIALLGALVLPMLGDSGNDTQLREPEIPTTTQTQPTDTEPTVAEQTQMQAWDDPSAITNLSFPILVVDTDRAFNDSDLGTQYENNFITIEEFNRILEQLYNNDYVLVDFDSFVTETTNADGSITFGTTPIYLPIGKKPIMLSQTLGNYMDYMVDSDDDGEYGDGFASRLVVRNGEITCEYIDATGNTHFGDYDFVPVLNRFIQEHPDFSYNGARAILAVTGEEGLFGYSTMPYMELYIGESYYDREVTAAKEVIETLRNQGYTIACNTYANEDFNACNAMQIQADLDQWTEEVTPILGECDTIIFARGSDISDYTGTKFNVLYNAGFCYFIGASDKSQTEVNTTYVHQTRLMVTGEKITNSATTYADYFDAVSVLDNARGMPTAEHAADLTLAVKLSDITLSEIGQSYTFELTGGLKNDQVTWISCDESIAKVDENGTVTCTGWGTTEILIVYDRDDGTSEALRCVVRCTQD